MAKIVRKHNPVKKGEGMVGGPMNFTEKIVASVKNTCGDAVTTVGAVGEGALKGAVVGGTTKLVLNAGVNEVANHTDTVKYTRKKGPFGLIKEKKEMSLGDFKKIARNPKEVKRMGNASVSGVVTDNRKVIDGVTTAVSVGSGACTTVVSAKNTIATSKRNRAWVTNQEVLNAQARRAQAAAERAENAPQQ